MQCQIGEHLYVHLFFILEIIQISTGSDPMLNTSQLWTWECVLNLCIPTQASPSAGVQSLETCNMLCATVQLWPQPTGTVGLSTNAVPVRSKYFQIKIKSAPSLAVRQHLLEAFHLFRKDLRRLEKSTHPFTEWYKFVVHVYVNGSGDPRMRMDTDESYILESRPASNGKKHLIATIYANSFCGARHALETLLQLIWFDPALGTLVTLDTVDVKDEPRFPYRGLLLDTARNFFPVRDIIRTLDAMAASKLNTFHWHVSDSEAFSLKFSSVPQLGLHGAYSPRAMYTPEDVQYIVHRARLRGIRVLIEVNTPAHVGGSWKLEQMSIYDNNILMCNDLDSWREYCEVPPCGQLNPRNLRVFHNLRQIYTEIISLTGVDDLFHIGGDFLPLCWQKYFRQSDPNMLLLQYTKNALRQLENANGSLPNMIILWMTPLSENMKVDLRDFVGNLGLQISHQRPEGDDSAYLSGIRTIISHSDWWDLNSGLGEWYEDNQGTAYNAWQRMYEYRPWLYGFEMSTVIGGEVTAWSSTLGVGGLDGRLWPRAAAFAERLWTDREEGASRTVHLRLDGHRHRLHARGFSVAPLWSMWCTQNPHTCL